MRPIFKCVVVLCLLLTVWSAVAVVVHHHANGAESVRCTICVAVHSAAPKALAHLLHATFAPISTVKAQPVSAQGRLIAFALSVRPPPIA